MDDWTLTYEGFDKEAEGLRETLCTLGNGYFCTRGAVPWADADEDVHYPGTYVHAGYNRLTTMIAGRRVANEDLVNLPNWLCMTFRVEGGDWLAARTHEVLAWKQTLDMAGGELTHTVHLKDEEGRETLLTARRFVSMHRAHLAAMEVVLAPLNWSGRVEVRSALDGCVVNHGVKRYRALAHHHLTPLESRSTGNIAHVVVITNQSRIAIGQAARTVVLRDGEPIDVDCTPIEEEAYVAQVLAFDVEEGHGVSIQKTVALYTSRDHASIEPGLDAREAVKDVGDYGELYAEHAGAWERLWQQADVEFPADERIQRILRLHVFHVLQTTSPHTIDLDTSAPARGLTGEAYRGHIFWDELYIFPFLNLRLPKITRRLLLYRYRRLDAARSLARAEGYRGAMFPWQSSASGREETQTMHLNPKSGHWHPDMSHHQRHVSLAIAFDTWEYVRFTGDDDFLAMYGAELLVEIARFWASIAHLSEERGRYEIHGVMGPDEFHEKYPEGNEHGLRNNAYTNVMVAWLMDTVDQALDRVDRDRFIELCEALDVTEGELDLWADMATRMYVPFHGDGLISQFEGYEKLRELDWAGYRAKYDNIQRMDRILGAEGDSADRYQLSKQADLLMLFYLFSLPDLAQVFGRLGYTLDAAAVARNVPYYEERTSHGSTLSNLVHAAVTASYAPEEAWSKFVQALESDVSDIQGGTTKEGVHLGVMAGTADLVQRGFLGLEVHGEVLSFEPLLAEKLEGLRYSFVFRGRGMDLHVEKGALTLGVHEGAAAPVEVRVCDEQVTLAPGEECTFGLRAPAD